MTTENNTLDLTEENPQEGVFKLEPIKGYAMLRWNGKRQFTATRYYPAQLKEQHGEAFNGWLNKIFWGDNLQVMSHLLREFRGKVDLIYIDPPFDSKADYKKKISIKSKIAENDQTAFEEKQYTDIWSNDEYLQFMYDRLVLMKELLSSKGSIYVHVGKQVSCHLKLILDEIYGVENYRAELIWQKLRSVKSQSSHFANMHDSIFVYSKTNSFCFIPQYEPKDERLLETHYRHVEAETGRRFNLADFTQAGQGEARYFGEKLLEPPVGKHWIWSQDRINEGMEKGLIVFSKNGVPYVKRYFDAGEGTRIGDIWRDINPVNQVAKERTSYPTQKPEELLKRIIQASSAPGDLVFDLFMGSGTTQAVAMKLGRRFMGADINLGAIQTTTKRLIKVADELKNIQPELGDEKELYTGFEVYNVNHYDVFRNPVQAKELLIQALDIQPIPNSIYDGEKDGRMVKLMPVNHIATKADVADLIHGVDYKAFEKRKEEKPNQPVEKMTLICMGHEPDLAAFVQQSIGYKLDIQVVDILRDRSDLQFKRDSEALFKVEEGKLIVDKFYPMNLLQKLSQTKDTVSDWREMVESIMIDWNYDGAVFQPALTDIPAKNELVQGSYDIPKDAGTIRIKITDLLSESLERDLTAEELAHG